VSIHSPMASFTAVRALCWVDPCAMEPGSSGTSASSGYDCNRPQARLRRSSLTTRRSQAKSKED
jgi:hypothetical protein